jgi:hypothetical protein
MRRLGGGFLRMIMFMASQDQGSGWPGGREVRQVIHQKYSPFILPAILQ